MHVHTLSRTHIHKVLRNVELINTPTHKDLLFILHIVRLNKDSLSGFDFLQHRHTLCIHTLTIYRTGPLKAILVSNI